MISAIKSLAITLVCILAISFTSLLIVKHADAQAIPAPSVPQFTVKFVNASYTVTTTNTYTGQSQTQLINNNSIEIMIENQPFDYSNNGLNYEIHFNIRIKPHFSDTDNWTEVYPLENLTSSPANANGIFPYAWYVYSPVQSNSTSTIIDFQVEPTDVYQTAGYDIYGTPFSGIPIDSQLDFQVEALVGHNSTYWYIQPPFSLTVGGFSVPAVAYDSASGWSNTQTVTIGEMASTSPTPTPSVPEFPALAILTLLSASLLVAVVLVVRKRKNLH